MDPFSAILCNAILIGKNKCVRIRKMEDGENSRVNFFLARCSAFVWSYSWHDRPWRWRASSMRWWSATEGRYGVVGDGYSAKEPGNLATCVGQRPMIIAYRPIHFVADMSYCRLNSSDSLTRSRGISNHEWSIARSLLRPCCFFLVDFS